MEKIQFALLHYAQLAIFVAACYGLGIWITRLDKSLAATDRIFSIVMTICVGMGLIITGLQALGILGLLNEFHVTALLFTGLAGFVSSLFLRTAGVVGNSKFTSASVVRHPATHWFFISLLVLIVVDFIPMPLHPPIDWDEVMYHLPHAREWARAGRLTINEGLRYPLFPYNFNLLYAAGLIYGNEIFPHMVNALAGWLVAVGLFRLADIYFNRAVAAIAVFIFVCLSLGQFGGAMADLGVTLFLFSGFSCVFIWSQKKSFSSLCVAAFLIGIAAGIKYQALTFLPLLAVAVLFRERRPLRLLVLLTLFALPCCYWYLRNYLVAGDPFSPMGGRIFGYWSWNAGDMALQIADIQRNANWPKPYVWPALGALLLRSKFGYAPFRAAVVFSVYAFAVWIFTSHYARYLMPAFPLIALLTAIVFNDLYRKATDSVSAAQASVKSQIFMYANNALAALFLAALSAVVFISFQMDWGTIQTSAEDRSAFLKTRIKSFEIGAFLQQHRQYRVVQIDLESDLYYLPPDTIGDVFGPGRYRQFDGLSSAELASRLRLLKANAILLSKKSAQSKRIMDAGDFFEHFVAIKKTRDAELYGLK
jgi:hypothetical protein